MRTIDRIECEAFGRSGKESLRLGLKASSIAITALRDGRPEAMFGVVPVNAIEGVGRAWFLSTDAALACARDLMERGPAVIAVLHARFRRLENMVSSDNHRAIRMLGRWGFEVEDETMMVSGVEFRPFWREKGDL
jgi:hypothetical protein